MADKKILSPEFFVKLTEKTDFQIATQGSLMHSRPKVLTPLTVINCIYGGGLPLSIMCEASGVTGSGKSTFLYQCMAIFQRDFPNGISVILDMETSMETKRLQALGVDTDKVLRLPATTLEKGFASLFKLLNELLEVKDEYEDLSIFIIYDSLAAGGTDKEEKAVSEGESAFGKGAIQEDVRIIKKNLKLTLPYFEKLPMFLGLINQVFVHPNMRNPSIPAKVESGGGNALKHLCHNHIVFGKGSKTYDGIFVIGSESKIELTKSKLSPEMYDIPCYIDNTQGGRIDETDSFVKYLADPSVGLIKIGGWYVFGDYIKKTMYEKFPELSDNVELQAIINKSYRKDDMYKLIEENQDLFYFLQITLIEFLDDIYPKQRPINEDYQAKLKAECKFF